MAHSALPRRAHLGLTLGQPELGSANGLVVRRVAEGSCSEQAGVKCGDRLLCVDEQPVHRLDAARARLRAVKAGQEIRLELEREGALLTLSGTAHVYPVEQHTGARVELGEVPCGSHRLRSIAIVPERPGPHPVVYFLPGAHWASEEYPLNLEHPVPALLGALARAGFASVRVERSGVGDSEGPPCSRVGFEAELEGYRAGLGWMRSEPWARSDAIFLLGHSVGAMVAPLLAAETEVSGVIAFGASALEISEGLIGAARRHWERTEPSSERVLTQLSALTRLIGRVVAGGRTPAQVFTESPELEADVPRHFHADEAYGRVIDFFQELERRDLARAWRAVRAPVLAAHGAWDFVSTLADARAIAALVTRAEVLELSGVDHHMNDLPDVARAPGALRLAARVRDSFEAWLMRQLDDSKVRG